MIFQGGKGNSVEPPRNLTSGDQIGDHYKIETAIDEVEGSVTRVGLLERLIPLLHDLPDLPQLTETELRTFRMHDWLAERAIGAPVSGRARGIDAEGALLIETGAGVQRILGGSIVPA